VAANIFFCKKNRREKGEGVEKIIGRGRLYICES
jgi:hypothetical protein